MSTDDFDYFLPQDLIAQRPTACRDQSRLLVLDRFTGQITHRPSFQHLLDYLSSGDLLVLNDSRVIPARLRGRKALTQGEIELLLLSEFSRNEWWAMLRPAKKVRAGTRLRFPRAGSAETVEAVVLEKNSEGHCRLQFLGPENISDQLEQFGELPLPPYITRPAEDSDRERYQTVFARSTGSIAAPTAGLHFTKEMLARIQARGIAVQYVTLHVGLGTFAPVKTQDIQRHPMHEERFTLKPQTAETINAAVAAGRRVVAVGTTTVRVLESVAAENQGKLVGTEGRTRIFIYPPFQFRIIKALLTNFHLPRSTLLMLVSAFAAPGETAGRELTLAAYAEAVRERYRFFSYGDAMFLM